MGLHRVAAAEFDDRKRTPVSHGAKRIVARWRAARSKATDFGLGLRASKFPQRQFGLFG